MTILISAAVCTHNRADYLRKALRSLTNQTLGNDQYDIIVVDNASTDRTKRVVKEFTGAPNLRYLNEPVLGLSRARNTAWRNAQGEYIAYLDDDAVASSIWLEKILEIFETFDPTPGSVGGKCEPIWEAPRPNWLSDKLLGFVTIIDWVDVHTINGEGQSLPGCNIAYRKALLQEAGGFREDLGRQGNILRTGEETFLGQQLASLGHVSLYHPEIVVEHHVSPSKLRKRWFRNRAYWQGLSDASMWFSNAPSSFALRMGKALSRITWALPRSFLMLVGTSTASRFRRQCQVIETMGFVSGLLWRSEKPV